MQSFLMKRFTKLAKINFRGAKQKSHTSNQYQITILHLVNAFRIKTFKTNIKKCHESMQS